MPLRGESVGTAYVRVLADATGFPDSLREEIDRDEPGIKRSGRHYAQAFEEGFKDEMDNADDLNLRAVLNRALGSNEATQQFFQGKEWDRFKSRMKNEFGSVGELSAHELEEKFVNSGSLRGLDNEVENIITRIANTTKRITAEQEKIANAAEKEAARVRKVGEDFRAVWLANDDTVQRSSSIFGRMFSRFRSGSRDVQNTSTIFGRLGKQVDHITNGVGRLFGKGSRNDFFNFTGSFIGGAASLLSLPLKIADNLGQLTNGFRNSLKEGEGFFTAIKAGFTEMAKDSEGAGTALSSSFATLLVSLPVAAAAIGGIILLLGPIAALISGIAGAVIALAGSLSFALVGAIAPLAAALVPLGAALGVVAVSLASLKKEKAKDLVDTLNKLKKGAGELGQTFVRAFGHTFDQSISNVVNKMKLLDPLFRVTGNAVGELANNIVKSLDSPQFARFLLYLRRQIPFAVQHASSAIGNLFSGIGTVLIDLVPQTRDFFRWLDKITADFKNFVQQNPDKVRQFFRDAAQSTKAVGHFLGESVKLLGTLLSQGKDTGDTIFDNLAKKIKQFNDFLSPKAQNKTTFDEAVGGIKRFQDAKLPSKSPLDDFFKNAGQVADDLGKIALGLGQIFDALDSPQGRKNLQTIMDLLTKIGDAAPAIEYMSTTVLPRFFSALVPGGGLVGHLGDVVGAIDGIARAIHRIGDIRLPDLNLGKKIKDMFSGIPFFHGSGQGGPIGVLSIKPPNIAWIGGVGDRIRGFFSGIQHAADRVSFSALGSKAGAAAAAVNARFAAIPGRLFSLTGRFAAAAGMWAAGILARISDIPGQILDYFRGLGSQIADAIGSISLHINLPNLPHIPGLHNPLTASGGIFDGAQWRIISERGPEAVVPLTGPLSSVDPSVRWLAELARGQAPTGPAATTPGKTINNEWHLTTVTPNVAGIANELLDRMATTGY
jgi:hypothetical protein